MDKHTKMHMPSSMRRMEDIKVAGLDTVALIQSRPLRKVETCGVNLNPYARTSKARRQHEL
jgi:hypothetical protein